MTMTGTWTRLKRSGDWGVRIDQPDLERDSIHDVSVSTKDGERITETTCKVFWSGDECSIAEVLRDDTGQPVSQPGGQRRIDKAASFLERGVNEGVFDGRGKHLVLEALESLGKRIDVDPEEEQYDPDPPDPPPHLTDDDIPF